MCYRNNILWTAQRNHVQMAYVANMITGKHGKLYLPLQIVGSTRVKALSVRTDRFVQDHAERAGQDSFLCN